MHCQAELERDLGYVGTLPDATLLQWHRDRYSTSKHLLTLYSIAHGLRARRIVEVGFGRSTFMLARAAHENGGTLESCDLQDFTALLSQTERRVVRSHVGDTGTFWPTVDAGVDLAFLDYFSAEGLDPAWIAAELGLCLQRLAPGGVIAIHDGFVAKYELASVLRQLRRQFGERIEQLTLPFNYGLTLLRRAESPTHATVDAFCKKPGDSAPTARELVTQPAAGEPRATDERPRILLIADVPDWIFARHCEELTRRLGHRYAFETICQGEPFDEDAYDLIYPLEWNLVAPTAIRAPRKYVTGVRSFTAWQDRAPAAFGRLLAHNFQRVHAVSHGLVEVLRRFVPHLSLLRHGVDLQRFTPTTRADQSGERLVLGWCGNRSATVKGTAALVEPLAMLPDVQLAQCAYRDGQRAPADMPAFYDSLDVYLCASASEGNNNAVMEAAAMGRAIVTTASGTVREWLRDGHSALIVEPTLPAIVAAIEHLRDHPRLRRTLGENARAAVHAAMDWSHHAADHQRFFDEALAVARAEHEPMDMPLPTQQVLAAVREELRAGRLHNAARKLSAARRAAPNDALLQRAERELQRLAPVLTA